MSMIVPRLVVGKSGKAGNLVPTDVDLQLLTLVACVLSLRNYLNQFNTVPDRPCSFSRIFNNSSWSAVSKAALRSSINKIVHVLASRHKRMSSTIFNITSFTAMELFVTRLVRYMQIVQIHVLI